MRSPSCRLFFVAGRAINRFEGTRPRYVGHSSNSVRQVAVSFGSTVVFCVSLPLGKGEERRGANGYSSKDYAGLLAWPRTPTAFGKNTRGLIPRPLLGTRFLLVLCLSVQWPLWKWYWRLAHTTYCPGLLRSHVDRWLTLELVVHGPCGSSPSAKESVRRRVGGSWNTVRKVERVEIARVLPRLLGTRKWEISIRASWTTLRR